MRIKSLDSIIENEVLARDIVIGDDLVLITSGTKMKRDYIQKLRELEIQYIYVEDALAEDVKLDEELDFKIKDEYCGSVKNIIKKLSSNIDDSLDEVMAVVETVIDDILTNPDIIYSVSYIREKSEILYSHSLTVCTLSLLIATKMNFNMERLKDLAIGALLHDIGLSLMDKEITKEHEVLLQGDLFEDKKHILYGYNAIESINNISSISKDIILQHHERIDGKGYPFQLSNSRITMESKIVAVCDVFDSLVNGFYAPRLKVHMVIDYIVSKASVKYDFDVVNAFIASVAAYPTGIEVITSEGESAIVIRQNEKCPNRPVIRVISDKNGNKYSNPKQIDLTKELTIYITDTVMP